MAINLHDISADVNDIASWVKDGSGNSIGSTGGALHVSDAGGSLTVDDGGSAISIDDNGGSITVDGSVTVSATDLDIRDLTHVSDSVKVGDGTDFLAVNNDGSINAVVSATNLDIRDLTHASDSVKIGDGTDFLAVNTDGSINVSAAALDTVANDTITVGTTEVLLVASSPVANRRYLLIQNNASNPIYVGATGVTTSNGVIIPKNGNLAVDASAGVYAIAAQAGNNVRIFELGLG